MSVSCIGSKVPLYQCNLNWIHRSTWTDVLTQVPKSTQIRQKAAYWRYFQVGSAKSTMKHINSGPVFACRFCVIWSFLVLGCHYYVDAYISTAPSMGTIISEHRCLTPMHDLFPFTYKKKLCQWYGYEAIPADETRPHIDSPDMMTQA